MPDFSREKNYQLTPREGQVAIAIAKGYSNTEIARDLFIEPRTVERHITTIFEKLAATNKFKGSHMRVNVAMWIIAARVHCPFHNTDWFAITDQPGCKECSREWESGYETVWNFIFKFKSQ